MQIYVYDRPVEVIARHVLLPAVACDFELPIRQRSSVYLEVFGNCLVQVRSVLSWLLCVVATASPCALQERTSKYLSQKRLELVDLLCNNRGPLHNLFDFSHLKYRHRDELETVFKSWDHRIAFDSTQSLLLHSRP